MLVLSGLLGSNFATTTVGHRLAPAACAPLHVSFQNKSLLSPHDLMAGQQHTCNVFNFGKLTLAFLLCICLPPSEPMRFLK